MRPPVTQPREYRAGAVGLRREERLTQPKKRDQSIIQKAPELPRPRRMLQFPQRFRLDLPNPFAGHRELLADFFQRMIRVHADAEAHAEHAFFAGGERGQNPRRGFAQVGLDRGVDRQDRVLVLDEIAEV